MPWATAGAAIGGAVLGGAATDYGSRRGASRDYKYYRKTAEYDWQMASDRGLTAQEFYGSPASGGSMGSANTQTLGNQYGLQAKAAADRIQENVQRDKDRAVQERGQDTQKEIAEIQTGSQQRVAGQNIEMQQKRLTFDEKVYRETTLPAAAASINKTVHETKKLVNDIVTSTPKFLRMMKIMTMSADNSLSLATQNMMGIDISDAKQLQSLSPDKKQKLLSALISLKSNASIEFQGVKNTIADWLDLIARSGQKLIEGAKDLGNNGIQGAPGQTRGHLKATQ